MLGPQMTLGHGVWLNEKDIDRLAETGTLRLPQLLIQFPPAFGRRGAQQLRGERHQHRDRPRRGRHQRRPRHAAGDADGAARASRARHGRRGADAGAGVPHGDRRRRQDHRLSAIRSARSRSARPPIWSLIDWTRHLSVSRRGDAAARRRDPARQDRRRAHRDLRRRGHLRRRPIHPGRPRRRARALHDDLQTALSDDEVERRKLSKALLPHVGNSTPTTSTPRSTSPSTGRAPASRPARCRPRRDWSHAGA